MLNVKGVPSIYRSIERVRSIWVNSDPTAGDAYLVSKLMVDALKEMSHKSNHEFLKRYVCCTSSVHHLYTSALVFFLKIKNKKYWST